MKKLGKTIGKAFMFCVVMMLICAFIYPFALTGLSQLAMKEKANGSLIDNQGNLTADVSKAVGSRLIGQDFQEECFFQGRKSAVNYNTYEAGEDNQVSSGSYNYGNSNPDLKKRMEEDVEKFLETHPDVKKEEIPADLLTASGSGLDPHISPKAAEVQVATVAEHSGLDEKEVEKIVEKHTEHKVLGVFGEERVNVLLCNLDIANAMGMLE